MEIKKAAVVWINPLRSLDLNKVTAIALHHMAHPTADIEDIDKWHKARGWFGFGYNYWVDLKGVVWKGRGLNRGAGVKGKNSSIISIGFQGDYENVNKNMPKVQFEAGVWLINYLKKKIPTIKTIKGHKYWGGTTCPGRYFPLEKMQVVRTNWDEQAINFVRYFQKETGLKVDGKAGNNTVAKFEKIMNTIKILKELIK